MELKNFANNFIAGDVFSLYVSDKRNFHIGKVTIEISQENQSIFRAVKKALVNKELKNTRMDIFDKLNKQLINFNLGSQSFK